ncbi:MAG TPA: ATP-binding protein [Candidatus Limnocylindria bacterium]|nr:ATP-binding protein [Candidatus Limnocylindria bacterium]
MRERRGLAGLRAALVIAAVAVAFAAIGVAIKVVIQWTLGVNSGFVVYVPIIAVAAWFRGLFNGLLVTVICAAVDVLLFLPPVAVLAIETRENQVRLAAYLLGGASVSFLSHRLRGARDEARYEAVERRRALQAEASARRRLDEMLADQQRSAVLREAFNSIVSHELRTPITSIYAGAKLLARSDRALDESTRRELTADIEQEAERLYRLVEDLLVLARTERGTIELADEPVMLSHIAERVVASERPRWPAARFDLRIEGDVPAARGDDTYAEQVLRNLLSNAAKYSPAGSRIEVVVDGTPEGARVRVMDEGAGISADEAALLFDLYYRSPATASTAGGAGIGLFVCRSLVDAMGGRVFAYPRTGGGSEFGFILPSYVDDAA